MSVSSLPEWKQLLLERKRREEEEREKREKEEEDKLASMPAWKRGIIQRRRMKQESFGDKEREDITGLVLKETIIPVGQNSFIRTHGGWRRGREAERAGEMAVEREVEQTREESERGLVKARSKGREGVGGREVEPQVRERRESDFRRGSEVRDMKRVSEVRDCTISVETTQQNCVITLSIDRASPPQSVDSHYDHVSAFTECSSTLLSTVAHKGTDWHSSQGAPGHHSTQSPLSQHTEDLINKIERVGGTTREYQPPHQLPHPSPPPSPSPSPSPTHFTIRSLSGGQQVKRGTTITITPRKPVGGAAVEAVSVSSRPLANTSAQSQMPVLTEEGEKGKKRYPTAEEIEVIGGYQNLDKSCLVKTSKASPKGVSVDCRLAYCRLCTINCIDEVSHLVEITPTTRATLPPTPYLILSV
uniref:Phostensin n=1 Tax=Oncorhynchus tshawytscha TaxID=74940 RepID=A0AAZ3QRL5_ONCTS